MPKSPRSQAQGSLFEIEPPGFAHAPEFITPNEETALLADIETLQFKPFAFQGWFGKRETVSFGWRYDFNDSRMHVAPPIPDFLLPLRARAAEFAGLQSPAFEQALVVRYEIGAGIGWHRDRPVFDQVVGVSLLSPCVLRFRRREGSGRTFRRFAHDAQRRAAYLLSSEIRHEWEHSIVPMATLRYSITFRSRKE